MAKAVGREDSSRSKREGERERKWEIHVSGREQYKDMFDVSKTWLPFAKRSMGRQSNSTWEFWWNQVTSILSAIMRGPSSDKERDSESISVDVPLKTMFRDYKAKNVPLQSIQAIKFEGMFQLLAIMFYLMLSTLSSHKYWRFGQTLKTQEFNLQKLRNFSLNPNNLN